MHEHFTDAENTGVPLVPMVMDSADTPTETGRAAEREEVVLSHRLRE